MGLEISGLEIFVASKKYSSISLSLIDMTLPYISFGESSSQMALPQDLLIFLPSVPVRNWPTRINDSLSRQDFWRVRPACILKVWSEPPNWMSVSME